MEALLPNEELNSSFIILHSSFNRLLQQRLGIKMIGFDILEVTVGTNFQFIGGGVITNDDSFLVHLQGTDGPHLHYRTFDGMLQGTGLVVTIDDNHHFAGT